MRKLLVKAVTALQRRRKKTPVEPPAPPAPPVAVVAKPRGIFTAQALPGSSDKALDRADCRGALVRISWDDIEPQCDSFDWALLDSYVAAVTDKGKQFSLAILGGPRGTPAWLINAAEDRYQINFRGVQYVTAAGWDAYYLQRLATMAKALADRYAGNPLLRLVYVTQATANGVEGHFNGTSTATLAAQGFTADKWVACSKAAAWSFARAFPQHAVAFEVHDVLDTHTIPAQIVTELHAESGGQIGAAMWWIRGDTDYQPELIDFLRGFSGDIYAQCIGKSNDTGRFATAYEYLAIIDQAKALGVRYLEPWPYEFTGGFFSAEFSEFNDWADATFK